MYRHYHDILFRITDPVLWFDEYAVPRFDPFDPGHVANIYAFEAALVRIDCQGCGHGFNVAFTGPKQSKPLPEETRLDGKSPLLRDYIRAGTLHYGDPPNIECCAAGPSMNSVPRKVLEYWAKPTILGEGLGCVWPRRENPHKPGAFVKSMPVILWLGALQFRREPELEIDIATEKAR